MRLSEILPQLQAWFPAEAHRERDLPGGGTWWYVPWQLIRDRLNQVCPDDWQVAYDDPKFLDKYCYVTCTLTICGVTRQAIGSAPIELLSSKGKDMARGNAIERAVADAFKNSCEQFGIAAYLDEQTADRAKFANYMHKRGNSKPAVQLQNEQRTTPKPATPSPPAKPFGQPQPTTDSKGPEPITEAQIKRFWAIARNTGFTDAAVKRLIEAHGFTSSKEISRNAYDVLCDKARDKAFADLYNETAQKLAVATEVEF